MDIMNAINDRTPSDEGSDKLKKIRNTKKSKKNKQQVDNGLNPNPPICQPIIPPDLSKEDIKQLEQITQHVNSKIEEVLRKEVEERTRKTSDIAQLKNIMAEFCNTFVVIGYTFDGEPFVIYNAKTAQDNNALAEHLRLTFMNVYKPPLF